MIYPYNTVVGKINEKIKFVKNSNPGKIIDEIFISKDDFENNSIICKESIKTNNNFGNENSSQESNISLTEDNNPNPGISIRISEDLITQYYSIIFLIITFRYTKL